MTTENYLDIGFVVIILILALRGMQNGLVQEIAGVIGVVLGVFIASKYYPLGAKYIEFAGLSFENKSILPVFSFILLLSVVWILCLVIGSVVSRFVVILPSLYIINYFGGFVFAGLKFFIIIAVIIYGLSQIEFLKKPMYDNFKNTKSYPITMEVAQKIMNIETLQNLKNSVGGSESGVDSKKDSKVDSKKDSGSGAKNAKDSIKESGGKNLSDYLKN